MSEIGADKTSLTYFPAYELDMGDTLVEWGARCEKDARRDVRQAHAAYKQITDISRSDHQHARQQL